MKTLFRSFYAKPLSLYLVVALIALSTFAGPAEAMYVPAAPAHQPSTDSVSTTPDRAADIAKIRTALESKVIKQKLMDFGLSSEEAMQRLNALSDEQVHMLASHPGSVQAGGDGVDLLIFLLLVAIIVVLILNVSGHRVIVR